MARRKTPNTIMKEAVDLSDPYLFCWSLLEIARKEMAETGEFQTLSMRDVKNLLQSLMQHARSQENNNDNNEAVDIAEQFKQFRQSGTKKTL